MALNDRLVKTQKDIAGFIDDARNWRDRGNCLIVSLGGNGDLAR
jgi:hypothetical protein